jgi:hypothetical protein
MGLEKLIADSRCRIFIVSGEGTYGTTEKYRGKRTLRAINMRLKKERCCGDRFAYAKIYSAPYDGGKIAEVIYRG